MSAALARRDDGCASDLLMDRWLLGEIPGSDEARRLEQHVRACSSCEARLLALRSLYGSRPAPRPTQVERPRLVSPPTASAASDAGVLQVVMLRDGLLVGTEIFTPGRYELGSDAACALRLEEVEPAHAVLHLRGDRVAIEEKRGPVFVNGYRVACCELRPIDEVSIGRYVLRTRVIGRDVDTAPDVKPPAPVIAQALKLELFWGAVRQAVAVFPKPPTAAQLERWGLTQVSPVDGGFELDGGVCVRHGDCVRLARGPLTVVASTVAVEARVERPPLREWPWLVISLASMLSVAVILFGVFAPVPEEAPFVAKELKAIAIFIPVPKHVDTAIHLTPHTPTSAPHRNPGRPAKTPMGVPTVRANISSILRGLAGLTPRKGTSRVATLAGFQGVPHESTPLHFFDGSDPVGIGNAGAMSHGNIGRGAPQGRVTSPGRVRTSNDAFIDRNAVEKVIQAHVSEISACYERAMLKNGNFAGKMLVEWSIDGSGSVTRSSVKETDVRNADFGACVLGALGRWKFPPAHGHVVVSYPFHLNSVGY